MPELIPARLEFTDGIPFCSDYGDVYHSADGGPGQARHVFLHGNRLPERWRGRERFVILETGFGTGLNFLATWTAWRADGNACRRLHFLSVEKHPFRAADLASLHSAWPEFAELSAELRAAWPILVPGLHRLEFEAGRVALTLLLGDAGARLGKLQARVDAFYLDGFAPAKNPDLWSPDLFMRLRRLAAADATLATWSVATAVREGLSRAGFVTEKTAGYGRKKAMLTGHFAPRGPVPASSTKPGRERRAIVLGAGLAGTACCERLAGRGWDVTLIDHGAGPASAASGNLAGIVMPLLARDDNIASRLSRAAFLYGQRHWAGFPATAGGPLRAVCGVMQYSRDAQHEMRQRAALTELGFPPEFAAFLGAKEAEARLGQAAPAGGWYFTQGGWANPPSLCRANLTRAGERVRPLYGQHVARVCRDVDGWRVVNADGLVLAVAPVLILATGAETADLAVSAGLPIQRVRGQVSLIPAGRLPPLASALCREGYATPAVAGWHAVGASYDLDHDTAPRPECDQSNLKRLDRLLPGAGARIEASEISSRVGFRSVAPDRLPLLGNLPASAIGTGARFSRLQDLPRLEGLYGALGYASRGLVWSALMAETLASILEDEPAPLETDLLKAIDPGRFVLRRLKKNV